MIISGPTTPVADVPRSEARPAREQGTEVTFGSAAKYIGGLAVGGGALGAGVGRMVARGGALPGAIAGVAAGALAGAALSLYDLDFDGDVPVTARVAGAATVGALAGAAALGVHTGVATLGAKALGLVGRAGRPGAAVLAGAERVRGVLPRTAIVRSLVFGGTAALLTAGVLAQKPLTLQGFRLTSPKGAIPDMFDVPPPDEQPIRPVIVIGGYGARDALMDHVQDTLDRDGFTTKLVVVSDRGFGDIEEAAQELAAAVEALKAETGSDQVDILAHSEGGLISRTYMELQGGAEHVGNFVTVATPHRGVHFGGVIDEFARTRFVRSVATDAGYQLLDTSRSDLLDRLNAPDTADGSTIVPTTTIRAIGHDALVPTESAWLPGARDIVLDGGMADGALADAVGGLSNLNHVDLVRSSPEAYLAMREALLHPELARNGGTEVRAATYTH